MTTETKLGALAALVLVLFGLGFYAGLHSHKCPAIPAKVETHMEVKQQDKIIDRAPEIRTVTKYETRMVQVPVPGPPGQTVYRTITEQVPVEQIIDQLGSERIVTESSDNRQSSLTLTPPPLAPVPGWAVALSLDSATDRGSVRIGLERRLFGQLWVSGSIAPFEREVGVGVAVHF